MKVNIVTTTRFHVANLAAELAEAGHEVHFYTITPERILRRHIGKKVFVHNVFYLVAPLLLLSRIFSSTAVKNACIRLTNSIIDLYAGFFMPRCDVLIGMSGIALFSLRRAKSRFNCITVLERASRHILSQKRILEDLQTKSPGVEKIPKWTLQRELDGYESADFVSIPSRTVMDSFVESGFPSESLFLNPFGVDLRDFGPRAVPESVRPTAIMVGTWSFRKGCDLFQEIWPKLKTPGAKLLHVGSKLDCPLPENSSWFTHIGFVEQSQLPLLYSQADIQVLISREEGLAYVQAQGLASGLVLVCTDRTGGEDLKEYVSEPERIKLAPADDIDAIARQMDEAFALARSPGYQRSKPVLQSMSWADYAKRYEKFLLSKIVK